ncbi:hypothetical protein [Nostoc sp.]|uniref:hypothetical protein n=1 Tax=Nostoc sp. TaxID=1180 RepID=UPI002FFCF40D
MKKFGRCLRLAIRRRVACVVTENCCDTNRKLRDRQGDLANDFKVSSYLRTDASIFYRRNSWKLGLNFKNLFNIDYIEVGQNRTFIAPGAPFTVVGSLSVEF